MHILLISPFRVFKKRWGSENL